MGAGAAHAVARRTRAGAGLIRARQIVNRRQRVGVLGAGIMGSCVALFLARRGIAVTLFDEAPAPLARASRWNEGKIHLGYLYAADPSLGTARRLIEGGLAFRPLLEELIEAPLAPSACRDDDTYLVHRESVVDVASMAGYFARVDELVRAHPAAGHASTRALRRGELERMADPACIVGGFRVGEYTVQTRWIADRLVAALAAQPRITARMNTRVTGVEANARDTRWRVRCANENETGEPFDALVNALWQGRPAIDACAGLPPAGAFCNRYRLSLFVRTARPLRLCGGVIGTGPFGDIKNYNDRDFYLSWYPAGLRATSHALSPIAPAPLDAAGRKVLIEAVAAGLASCMPASAQVFAAAQDIVVEGGFVFALGSGSLADAHASLHRRDRFGVQRVGSYFSVDTGKYSTAPWLARQLAQEIAGDHA